MLCYVMLCYVMLCYDKEKMFSSEYFIISRPRVSRKLCLPRLSFESAATFQLLDRYSIPTELHGRDGLKTGNYEQYTECREHTRLY